MRDPKNSLDDFAKISQLDKSQMAKTIASFPQQLEQTWGELKDWKPNLDSSKVENIVTVGMGGSGLGAHFINSLFGDEFKIPHLIINDYKLPKFVGKNSLVFLISYSGNTREVLEAGRQALARKAKIVVITTGGKLGELAKKSNLATWIFEQKFNFATKPLTGLDYLILGQILILKSLSLIEFSQSDFERILAVTRSACQKFGTDVPQSKNLAKSTAVEIFGKIPVIFASQYLLGNAHIMSNQINENGKLASFWLPIPEADHHFLEAGKSQLTKENLVFVNLISQFYDDEVKKRFEISKDLALQNMVKVIDISLESQIPFEESFSVLVLTSWISFYLAILDNIDPTPISTVDFFKRKLQE